MGGRWSEDDITIAARMKREGKSFADIARTFGVSRSAVAGLVHRNRALFANSKNAGAGGPKKGHAVHVEAASVRAETPCVPAREPEAEEPIAPFMGAFGLTGGEDGLTGPRRDLSLYRLPDVAPTTTLNVGAGECRFPLSAFDAADDAAMPLCGAPAVDGKSWCKAHERVVYRPRGEAMP